MMTPVHVPEPEDFKGPWYKNPFIRSAILIAVGIVLIYFQSGE